ncbi:TPA: hypothetical protein ACP4YD_004323 [Escherichia coli]
MNNISTVYVARGGMSPYNEFRLRRLVGGLRAAEFGVECWEKAKYTRGIWLMLRR